MKMYVQKLIRRLFPLNSRQKKAFQEIRSFKSTPNCEVACVIFSKDRPIQLFALLESISELSQNLGSISIIYNYESEEFQKAYEQVQKESPLNIKHFLSDNKDGFKSTLMNVLKNTSEDILFFLVDDIVFTHKFDFNLLKGLPFREGIFSLRLGETIRYSYMARSAQKIPKLKTLTLNNQKLICWNWNEEKLDWGYPLSVDGHLFCKDEIFVMTQTLDFFAPNSYEKELQRFSRAMKSIKKGFALKKPVLFNNPCNMVQKEIISNRSGNLSTVELLNKWNERKSIDVSKFKNHENTSVHEELKLTFKARLP